MARFSDLPDSVVEDIMSRLPGDSLVELKRVKSSWYFLISALINDQKFINIHFHNTKDKSSTSLVVDQSPPHASYENKIRFLIAHFNQNDFVKKSQRCFAKELNLPPLAKGIGFPAKNSSWQVGCHCDGILCLFKVPLDMDVMLCNPVLQKFKLLPESKNSRTNTEYSAVGFGYDSKAKDYKFVRVIDCPKILAEIYTLGTDAWKEISMPKDLLSTKLLDALYWKGICYWEVEDNDYKEMILSFDMCDEVFHTIPLPEESTFPAQRRSFALWNDSVALFNHCEFIDAGSIAFEVCVMADYCNILKGGTPWIKFLVVRPQLGYLKPLTFWNKEEVLLKAKGGWICSYNIRTRMLRHTG